MTLNMTAVNLLLGAMVVFLILYLTVRRVPEKEDLEINYSILGPEDIERHALKIARSHTVGRGARFTNRLLPQLNKNYRFIFAVYKSLTKDSDPAFPSPPTAEWLLDNFYIIEEQVKDIRVNLTKKYYAHLPVLKSGFLRGYPRAYAIALELVSHTDGMIDERTLINFIRSYQTHTVLSVGELWAVAIMLRLSLIENIRYICDKLIDSQKDWQRAEELAQRVNAVFNRGDEEVVRVLDEGIRGHDALSPSFIEHLVQKLRRYGNKSITALKFINEKLAEADTSIEKLADAEHQIQAARQVSMGNSITSLRLVSAMDWNEIFESLSQVEEILQQDPAGIYTSMDFDSRDHYRHEVEKLARFYTVSETLVAKKAVECSSGEHDSESPANHIGYYLIGAGRRELEAKIGAPTGKMRFTFGGLWRKPQKLYFTAIGFLTLLVTAGFLSYARSQGNLSLGLLILAGLVFLVPVSEMAITLVNFIVSQVYKPSIIPKLELKEGISGELATMIIVPTLLPNVERVTELIGQLEIYYLSNKERNLYFALVGDFKDAPEKETLGDREIVQKALDGVRDLNKRYSTGQDIFYFFHRNREYSKAQNNWMGWERKRGAIIELNDLLRGAGDTGYQILSCDFSQIPQIRYIITLDADTQLPIGTAKKLVGTMAHPLNRAVIDQERGVVSTGYGLLQPRITVNLVSANSTFFSRIFAGQGGIDPYTTAVSDVYQDLFGEGIFTGKGIYDLDVFQALLKDTIPENTVLSHDLLEGSYIRTGLVTDIELVDGYPSRYNAFSMRLHRWVRGDWQLLPWLGSRVRDREGKRRRNPLSALSKWKIIDNLRRSLLQPALLLTLLLAVSVLPGSPYAWLGLVALTLVFATMVYLAGTLLAQNGQTLARTKNPTVVGGLKAGIYQAALQFVFIPYQAWLMLDAISKTLYRVFVSKKNLLEWIPAADMEASLKNSLGSFIRKMGVTAFAGILAFALALFFKTPAVPVGVLLLLAWVPAPIIAYNISRHYVKVREQLSRDEFLELRLLARKTWRYFEDLMTARENYLPPDNYQEDPPNGIAHRTSPTNIGMGLVAAVAARDMGFIGTPELFERVDKTLTTIEKLEKWEGHLYNWYDTRSLQVLRPRYVSTVDSGNLVGYLMVLEESLKEYFNKPLLDISLAEGIRDTVTLFNGELAEKEAPVIGSQALEAYLTRGASDVREFGAVLDDLLAQVRERLELPGLRKSFWGLKTEVSLETLRFELYAGDRAGHSLAELEDEKGNRISELRELCQNLIVRVHKLAEGTRFAPLFDSKRQLFSIGYNVEEGRLTKSYYDLLASEARQASYIAIARGEVDKRHWFRLGRKLTMVDGYKGLVSWTGTMFEYLMPPLIMRNFENSLLDETYNFVVKSQQKYGVKRNIPWGTSESAYFAFDVQLNYQYKAFGVPELGFKRGLANDMVVAPYATVMALGIDPIGAVQNIRRLVAEGMDGAYGLYEAVDYTPSRQKGEGQSSIVKNFMVHHQGMSMLAFNNLFFDNIMQARFHANQMIRAAELLLQERVPLRTIFTKEYKDDFIPVRRNIQEEAVVIRKYGVPDTELPQMHLLSNGRYTVMVTNGGSGFSKLRDTAVARWRESLRGTGSGMFIYVQNINANNVWSATFEPYNTIPENYSVVFSPDKAEFIRKDGNIETHTEIVVSNEDNTEIRKVSLTNQSEHARIVEVTSYLEVVLTQPDADLAHPAFSNLFVTTEYVPEYQCLLASRRPRSEGQKPLWAAHTVAVEGEIIGDIQFETDRARFIGRNRDLSDPLAMDVDQPLSNTVGAVLDPIFSLRRRVRIEPGKTIRLSYTVSVADDRQEALALAEKYRDSKSVERAFELSWNRSQIESRYLDLKEDEVELYLNMVPSMLFAGPARRKWEHRIIKNRKAQPGLWPFGISGDLPLLLFGIKDKNNIDLVHKLLKAHEFWRMKGFNVDLVFLLEDESSYTQPLNDKIRDAISASHARELVGQRGGVFILNSNVMAEEDLNLLYAVARLVLKDDEGPLEEQIQMASGEQADAPKTSEDGRPFHAAPISGHPAKAIKAVAQAQLKFFNGTGGFTRDGKEYLIYLREGRHTPAPWSNVISNKGFGFMVTEVGAGYTWAENSRENKLTPWNNDPVTDEPGEIYYLRDEDTGRYWSLTPEPIRGKEDYVIHHGRGYSTFEHTSGGIDQQLTLFAAADDPVKIALINLKNTGLASRKLSLTYYLRPVLGVSDKVTAPYIVSEGDPEKGIIFMTNAYNSDFPDRVAFAATSEQAPAYTGNRTEFIGINHSLNNPLALEKPGLSGNLGAGLDPCIAMQVQISLAPGESRDVVFLLGQTKKKDEAYLAAAKFNSPALAREELERVKNFWTEKLESIQVATPDTALDFMLNGWLQYQVISCRLWSRAAFYQSGGAYGFRDQLQDVMAVTYTWPEITRNQILLHAAHQFKEGDVQHWWHPGVDKGIRTRYSDDFLWLPYVTADYIKCSGDWSVLDEVVPYLEDELLPPEVDERYAIPRVSEEKGPVYEHCIRSIENALRFGEHGLPLMGCGDWNDGMNTVGNKGRGESVWMGWFLYTVLQNFIPVCEAREDKERAERYRGIADQIVAAIEAHAWDGSWYRRAYFDDGTPLGSTLNSECKIDSLSQSWSVISGVGRPQRAEEAMNALENYLIDREVGIIKLLSPPFYEGDLDPGYIKGYVPGVRENGGQYTHAAVWTILAFARLGRGDKVGELFHMINPINHARTAMESARYKVEPYVVAADVYAVEPNKGRGGWTWYTGAAGWMYRVGLEHILGIKKNAGKIVFDPCIPKDWSHFTVRYRLNKTMYFIDFENPEGVNTGVAKVTIDGKFVEDKAMPLTDDGAEHHVEVLMGPADRAHIPHIIQHEKIPR